MKEPPLGGTQTERVLALALVVVKHFVAIYLSID